MHCPRTVSAFEYSMFPVRWSYFFMHCLRTVSAFEYSGGGAISLCTAYGLCLPLNIPVELFLYSLPKDCTAQGLCLPLNIPCFQSGGTTFWSKTYKKLKKNQLRENKKFKTRVNVIFSNAFQRICWKCCHVLLHVFILVVWFVIDGLFFFLPFLSIIFWKLQIDPFYC